MKRERRAHFDNSSRSLGLKAEAVVSFSFLFFRALSSVKSNEDLGRSWRRIRVRWRTVQDAEAEKIYVASGTPAAFTVSAHATWIHGGFTSLCWSNSLVQFIWFDHVAGLIHLLLWHVEVIVCSICSVYSYSWLDDDDSLVVLRGVNAVVATYGGLLEVVCLRLFGERRVGGGMLRVGEMGVWMADCVLDDDGGVGC